MSPTFADLVEEIRQRPLEEKDELLQLLQREVAEARRDEISRNAEEARSLFRNGELQFTSSLTELKNKLHAS
jgi:hypothetical protein